MDSFLLTAILDALSKGDYRGMIAFVLIFIFIWIEVRGLKKEFAKLNAALASGFRAGELRFEALEKNQKEFEHRLSLFESKPKG